MKFKNLDCNILYVLGGEDCCRRGDPGPSDLNTVYVAFPDLQKEDVHSELKDLCTDGFLTLLEGGHKIALTPKGIEKVKSLPACRNFFVRRC